MQQQWKRLDGSPIRRPILDEMRSVLANEKAMGYQLKVCIGTDSAVRYGITDFAIAIVILRKGRGGFMFTCQESWHQPMNIKERMLMEVTKSIGVAYELCELLNEFEVDMEVHADINTNPGFKSNDALKDAMGYITGMGFAFKAKPHAFASSCCADKVA